MGEGEWEGERGIPRASPEGGKPSEGAEVSQQSSVW